MEADMVYKNWSVTDSASASAKPFTSGRCLRRSQTGVKFRRASIPKISSSRN
jgi:hypothetical protein